MEQGILTREKADQLVRDAERKAQDKRAAAAPAPAEEPLQRRRRARFVCRTYRDRQERDSRTAQAGSAGASQERALGTAERRSGVAGQTQAGRRSARALPVRFAARREHAAAGLCVSRWRAAAGAGAHAVLRRALPTLPTHVRRWPPTPSKAASGCACARASACWRRVSDSWSGGLRIATGNTTDRVSTNQTLGQNFNKYQLTLDQGYLKYEPAEWLSVSAGRIPNPWFSTDLVWDEDLNFEGLAATVRPRLSQSAQLYLTAGAFPLREDSPPTSDDRWLYGVQGGLQWDLSPSFSTRLGVAYYRYENLEGQLESASKFFVRPDHRHRYADRSVLRHVRVRSRPAATRQYPVCHQQRPGLELERRSARDRLADMGTRFEVRTHVADCIGSTFPPGIRCT